MDKTYIVTVDGHVISEIPLNEKIDNVIEISHYKFSKNSGFKRNPINKECSISQEDYFKIKKYLDFASKGILVPFGNDAIQYVKANIEEYLRLRF